MTNFKVGATYTFSVFPVALLGDNFKNVTVVAIMDYETAMREVDVRSAHISYYPYLPSGTPNNAASYTYIRIKTTAGNTTVLGVPWIDDSTVIETNYKTANIVIPNITADDLPRIKAALSQNGFTIGAVTLS